MGCDTIFRFYIGIPPQNKFLVKFDSMWTKFIMCNVGHVKYNELLVKFRSILFQLIKTDFERLSCPTNRTENQY